MSRSRMKRLREWLKTNTLPEDKWMKSVKIIPVKNVKSVYEYPLKKCK